MHRGEQTEGGESTQGRDQSLAGELSKLIDLYIFNTQCPIVRCLNCKCTHVFWTVNICKCPILYYVF